MKKQKNATIMVVKEVECMHLGQCSSEGYSCKDCKHNTKRKKNYYEKDNGNTTTYPYTWPQPSRTYPNTYPTITCKDESCTWVKL